MRGLPEAGGAPANISNTDQIMFAGLTYHGLDAVVQGVSEGPERSDQVLNRQRLAWQSGWRARQPPGWSAIQPVKPLGVNMTVVRNGTRRHTGALRVELEGDPFACSTQHALDTHHILLWSCAFPFSRSDHPNGFSGPFSGQKRSTPPHASWAAAAAWRV